jgi:hypothetical protein
MNSNSVFVDGGGGVHRHSRLGSSRTSDGILQVPVVTVDEGDDEDEDELNAVETPPTAAAPTTAESFSGRPVLPPPSLNDDSTSSKLPTQHRHRRAATVGANASVTAAESKDDEQLLAAASGMSRDPRLSLLGRPIGLQRYRASRRDAEIRRMQAKVYNFLERPKDWLSIGYHITVYVYILVSAYGIVYENSKLFLVCRTGLQPHGDFDILQ